MQQNTPETFGPCPSPNEGNVEKNQQRIHESVQERVEHVNKGDRVVSPSSRRDRGTVCDTIVFGEEQFAAVRWDDGNITIEPSIDL